MRKSKNKYAVPAAGFTIIELLLVITIMSILFSVVFFGLDGVTDGSRLDSSARGLRAFITDARNRAICERKRLYIIYMPAEGVVRLCDSMSRLEEPPDNSEMFRLAEGTRIKSVAFETENAPEKSSQSELGQDGRIVVEVSSLGDIQNHKVILANRVGEANVKIDGILGMITVE